MKAFIERHHLILQELEETKKQLEKAKEIKTYNGWTNYATWRVNLELFDNYQLTEYQEELSTYDLSTDIKEETEFFIAEDNDTNSFCFNYAIAFINQVNFYEIAEHIKERSFDIYD